MKRTALVCLSLASLAWGDPPYPMGNVEGYFIPDLIKTHKFTFEPGAFVNCTENSFATYSYFYCESKDAWVTVDTGSAKVKATFRTLNVTAVLASATVPATLSYDLYGRGKMPLPDGTDFETDVSLWFQRKMDEPEKVVGRLSFGTGAEGAIVAKWPEPPTIK